MNSQIIGPLITGCFSLAGALGGIWFKHYLEQGRKEQRTAHGDSVSQSTGPARARVPAVSWLRAARRPLVLSATVFVLGSLSHLVRTKTSGPVHYEALVSLGVLILTSGVLVYQHRRRRTQTGPIIFQMELFGVWAGYTAGWSAAHGSVWSDLVVVQAGWWLGCAVLGSAMLAWLRRRQPKENEVSGFDI